ncbi:hypothetical protein D3C80_2069700 [compost metagenome]
MNLVACFGMFNPLCSLNLFCRDTSVTPIRWVQALGGVAYLRAETLCRALLLSFFRFFHLRLSVGQPGGIDGEQRRVAQ